MFEGSTKRGRLKEKKKATSDAPGGKKSKPIGKKNSGRSKVLAGPKKGEEENEPRLYKERGEESTLKQKRGMPLRHKRAGTADTMAKI